MNLQEMLARSEQFDTEKEDYLAPLSDILFNETGIAVTEQLFGTTVSLPMTDWALGQACDKLGPPPRSYMRDCPGDLRATNLNHWKEEKEDKTWLVRTYQDEARAVLSKDYSVLSNTDVIETMITVMGDTPYEPVQPHIDPDATHIKIKVTGDGKNYGQGVYVGNGETGNYKLRVLPFIQRISCDNSIVWKGGGVELRHWRIGKIDLLFTLKRFMGEALNKTQEMMERVLKAELETIPNFADYVQKFCKENGVSEVGYGVVMSGTEAKTNCMSLVNGLTYYAHEQEDQDTQIRLETLGAEVLFGRKEPTQL